jgi:hypothetical protein
MPAGSASQPISRLDLIDRQQKEHHTNAAALPVSGRPDGALTPPPLLSFPQLAHYGLSPPYLPEI